MRIVKNGTAVEEYGSAMTFDDVHDMSRADAYEIMSYNLARSQTEMSTRGDLRPWIEEPTVVFAPDPSHLGQTICRWYGTKEA